MITGVRGFTGLQSWCLIDRHGATAGMLVKIALLQARRSQSASRTSAGAMTRSQQWFPLPEFHLVLHKTRFFFSALVLMWSTVADPFMSSRVGGSSSMQI
jgi:hypothetical protein